MIRWVLAPRPVSIWLNPIEFGVLAVLIGVAAQFYISCQMYRQLRRLVWLHEPRL